MQRVIAMDVKRSHPSQFSINSTNAERQHKAKLNFLNACIYEYVQRVHFHQRIPITGTDIRGKAAEFAGLINFNTFTPNKLWLFDFLKHYKLQIPIERMVIKQRPIMNFEPSQIIAYCRQFLMKARSKVPQTKPLPPSVVAKSPSFNSAPKPKPPVSSQLYMLLNDRKRLENFKHEQGQILALEKALYEFIQRARYKRVQLSNGLLMRTAGELCHKLQIKNFQPTRHWLQHFKNRYDFNVLPATAATSLDLGNILNYCQQHENRNNILTYLGLQQVSTIKSTSTEQSTNVEIICLDDDDEENGGKAEKKFATDLNANNILRGETESTDRNSHIRPPPIKLKPIEALLSPQVLQNLKNTVPLSLPIMPNTMQLPQHQKLDKPALHTEDPKSIQKPVPAKPATPVLLRSNAEVLEYLKPLEEFAMLRDNYRVIGILSQLEQILKEKA